MIETIKKQAKIIFFQKKFTDNMCDEQQILC